MVRIARKTVLALALAGAVVVPVQQAQAMSAPWPPTQGGGGHMSLWEAILSAF
jgi:Spy/CpxP family protein refolding chaperone